jgi:hypothetical protein
VVARADKLVKPNEGLSAYCDGYLTSAIDLIGVENNGSAVSLPPLKNNSTFAWCHIIRVDLLNASWTRADAKKVLQVLEEWQYEAALAASPANASRKPTDIRDVAEGIEHILRACIMVIDCVVRGVPWSPHREYIASKIKVASWNLVS